MKFYLSTQSCSYYFVVFVLYLFNNLWLICCEMCVGSHYVSAFFVLVEQRHSKEFWNVHWRTLYACICTTSGCFTVLGTSFLVTVINFPISKYTVLIRLYYETGHITAVLRSITSWNPIVLSQPLQISKNTEYVLQNVWHLYNSLLMGGAESTSHNNNHRLPSVISIM
jgi:hypothetical protein